MADMALKLEAGGGSRPTGETTIPPCPGCLRWYRRKSIELDFARSWKTWLLAALVAGHGLTAQAVIFYSTADPEYNTAMPPTGLEGAWAMQGVWLGFAGTPIAEQYFITAKHVGAVVGTRFSLGGQ